MSDLHCPARVIVARHGEAEYESEAMTAAGGSLTSLGRDQARALGERLSGERVAGIVCSDLARAVQTAEIAARVLDLPVRVREGLQEFPPGDFWGRPYDHAVLRRDGAGLAGRRPGRRRTGRGDRASRSPIAVLAVLDDVADQYRGETVLVVSHGGVILALWGGSLRVRPPRRTPDRIANCSTYVLERDADGWRLGAA